MVGFGYGAIPTAMRDRWQGKKIFFFFHLFPLTVQESSVLLTPVERHTPTQPTKNMKILNLTPHAVNISGITLPPSGIVARVGTVRTRIADVVTNAGIFPAYTVAAGDITDIPDYDGATMFIVSAMVRTHPAVNHRDDLASPGLLMRDANGVIIGADGLDFNP
jgi:hypothetical protein